MTTVSVEEFRGQVDRYLAAATQDAVVLTQDGKPWLVVQAVPMNGVEDSADFARSAAFWEMIRERRQEQGIPWEEARKHLGLEAE